MPSFGQAILDYHDQLTDDWKLPEGVDILFPYDRAETRAAMSAFYEKFYPEAGGRVFLFGINPGRFGAGVTGVPFTDPVRLEEVCGIPNPFDKKAELSSTFVYAFIHAMGGPAAFARHFYITSLSPLGFIRNGKNWNYYDDKATLKAVTPHIIEHLQAQLDLGADTRIAFSMGRGKNFDFFNKVNAQYDFFERIEPLPHPRWVMQYRRKKLEYFIEEYRRTLTKAVPGGS